MLNDKTKEKKMIKDDKNDEIWGKLDTAEDLLQEVWQHLADNGVELGNDDGLIIEMRDGIRELIAKRDGKDSIYD